MIDSIEQCSAKHCEEPDGPGNMVLCSSFGCRLAMVDFDYAVSLDVCPVTGKDWFCNGDCKADSGVRSKKCRLV